MRSSRAISFIASGALLLLSLAAAACGDDSDAPEGPSPTPFSLGSTLTIRGQEVTLPEGVTYTNQSPECQKESTSSLAECLADYKIIVRGNSYIIFQPSPLRVVARRIEPEDESDFRPLLGLISGTTGADSSSPASPAPSQ